MINESELLKFSPTKSRTGEDVKLMRVKCECGHVLTFLSFHPKTCSHCGRLKFANKKAEFDYRLKRKLKI